MNELLRKRLHKLAVMLKEPSSWRGVVVVLTGLGSLSPVHGEAIVAGGLILAGVIAIFLEP